MKIFGIAADPSGWMSLLDGGGENLSLTAVNNAFGASDNYAFKIDTCLRDTSKYVKVPVSGNRVFALWTFYYRIRYGGQVWSKDLRKIICVYNSEGLLLFSLGHNLAGTNDNAAASKEAIFTWNPDGTVKAVVENSNSRTWGLLLEPGASGRGSSRPLPYVFGMEYYNDPDDATKSFAALFKNGAVLAQIPVGGFPAGTNNTPASFTFFEGWPNTVNTSGSLNMLSSLVVTDTRDLTLKPFVLKPLAITSNTAFTGAVADIAEPLQDQAYLASAAESGVAIEFTLTAWALGISPAYGKMSNETVAGFGEFFYGRYINASGGAAGFSVAILDSGGNVISSRTVSVTANEDIQTYHTKLVAIINDLVLTYNQLLGCKVRITLEGV